MPRWSTVRYRYWKNQAFDYRKGVYKEGLKYELTKDNLTRMERGLAPQVYDIDAERWVSVELHHEPPQRQGGLFDFVELTPEEHACIDAHRNIQKIPEDLKGES